MILNTIVTKLPSIFPSPRLTLYKFLWYIQPLASRAADVEIVAQMP
jgi:hypothetical protein